MRQAIGGGTTREPLAPGTADSDADGPGADGSGVDGSEAGRRGADGPGADVSGSDGLGADGDEAAVAEPAATESDTPGSDASKPDRPTSDAPEPDEPASEDAEAKETAPEGPEAKGAAAEGTTPDASGPPVSEGTAPDASDNASAPASGGTAPDASGDVPASRARRGSTRLRRGGGRFPLFTRDTARPEGGGRAAPRDAPAPARQWPILAVLGVVALGLLLTALDVFRVGTLLIGFALLAGGALRWVMPDVGMLAVRSRFTDICTYGALGLAIVVLAMMAQPDPWLQIPFLKDTLHFTVSSG